MRRVLITLGFGALAAIGLATGLVATSSADATVADDHKVTICHKVNGEGETKNGFNIISVDKDSIVNKVGDPVTGGNGHGLDSEDIIPAFAAGSHQNNDWGAFAGRGNAAWINTGCVDGTSTDTTPTDTTPTDTTPTTPTDTTPTTTTDTTPTTTDTTPTTTDTTPTTTDTTPTTTTDTTPTTTTETTPTTVPAAPFTPPKSSTKPAAPKKVAKATKPAATPTKPTVKVAGAFAENPPKLAYTP